VCVASEVLFGNPYILNDNASWHKLKHWKGLKKMQLLQSFRWRLKKEIEFWGKAGEEKMASAEADTKAKGEEARLAIEVESKAKAEEASLISAEAEAKSKAAEEVRLTAEGKARSK
jgi:membrane protein involved in colicin uptake